MGRAACAAKHKTAGRAGACWWVRDGSRGSPWPRGCLTMGWGRGGESGVALPGGYAGGVSSDAIRGAPLTPVGCLTPSYGGEPGDACRGQGGPVDGVSKRGARKAPLCSAEGCYRYVPAGRKAGRWDGREGSAEGSLPECPLTPEKASVPQGRKRARGGGAGDEIPLPGGIKRGVEQPPCKVSRRRCAVLPRTSCEPIYLRSGLRDGLCGGRICADAT